MDKFLDTAKTRELLTQIMPPDMANDVAHDTERLVTLTVEAIRVTAENFLAAHPYLEGGLQRNITLYFTANLLIEIIEADISDVTPVMEMLLSRIRL